MKPLPCPSSCRPNGPIPGLICTVIALALISCGVKKEIHQKVLDELTAARAELDQTRAQRDKLARNNANLSGDLTSESAKASQLAADAQATQAELDELRKQRQASEKRLAAFRELTAKFKALVDTGKLQVKFRNGQMVLELPSGILFASGQATLSQGGETALADILGILQSFKDRRFMIAGHTDNVPIQGRRFPNNWALSTARALSVVDYMVSFGFPATHLAAAGYGEFSPVAENDSPEGRQQNRRIEIILVPDLSELPSLDDKNL